jgi:hypothetical protein
VGNLHIRLNGAVVGGLVGIVLAFIEMFQVRGKTSINDDR